MELHEFKKQLCTEVSDNIFDFWLNYADRDNGGFYCYSDFEGMIDQDFDKSVLLHSRILWGFSNAYRILGQDKYLNAAKHCFQFMMDKAIDKEFGGVFWMLDKNGNVSDSQKHIYNQGFAIYAFSEYFLASGDELALEESKKIFSLIEEHSYDELNGGYIEAFDREWKEIDNHLVCDTAEGVLAEKSMNTHLHIMEAYTTLHKAWKNSYVEEKIQHLLQLICNKVVDERLHYGLFFTRDWQCVSTDISYGHDIEGTWLMDEAAAELSDREFANNVFRLTTEMAQTTLKEGVDVDGAVFNELREGHLLDTDRIWWVQAEAMVGFFNAYQKEPKPEFIQATLHCWNIIQSQLLDRENGEWFWKTKRNGQPYFNEPKVEPWKCPYHNGRACLELYSRLDLLEPVNSL
ncbi:AGE family epimerase/isomerase [Vibrio sp. TH_r3]|uniref:AGE family epimerase/isomerase n=1 Tax=Vibrio sp. TH_r3 TaxID=3082084 RepID=UPI002954C71C|nr:AGE family epimerase/isomerase [Vibrio sp. TH_r3]MDV7105117.1 AGE family epimerase/isomerase [Vibrio sp. TH_r3]